jgi:type II secretory pathway component PulF
MTILIESGTSVPLGLDALAKQMPTSYFKQVVIHLTQLVREGHMIDVYQEAGVSLPIITRLLLVVYAAVANYWFISLPLRYLRSPHATHFVTQE